MASVRSLGHHQPAGLRHAIEEQILPKNAPPSSYTWDISVDNTDDTETEDELLTTKHCVIWCRGGIVQKTFRFELEKETITQALLAYFPTSEDAAYEGTTAGNSGQKPAHEPILSKALVVFFKTQAHIYFLNGTSHVIHMPFEVEAACAAPIGVIIQRKARASSSVPVMLKFPKIPQTSFVSSQMSDVTVTPTQPIGFSTEGLGKPKTLPIRLSSTLGNMWDTPLQQPESSWPLLLCLTDPLKELGLIVAQTEAHRKDNKARKQHMFSTPNFLEAGEEILHVEQMKETELWHKSEPGSLTFAVTVNRTTSTYTVWRVEYLKPLDPFTSQSKQAKSKAARRRSSMQPGFQSESTTPVHATFRESFGVPLPGKRPRKSEKVEKPIDIVTSLEQQDTETATANRRSSRRVSSMLARADLSSSQDRSIFADQPVGIAASRRLENHGGQYGRKSGGRGSLGYNQTIHPSLNSLIEAPIDSVLDELRTTGDFDGFNHMGLDDHGFEGLQQEMVFTKIQTVGQESSNIRYSLSEQPARYQSRVFILPSTPFSSDDHRHSQFVVGIQDPIEKRLILLPLHVHRSKQIESLSPTGKKMPPPERPQYVIKQGQVVRAQNVVDSCKIVDGNMSMILILSEAEGPQPVRIISIQAPWSNYTSLNLPSIRPNQLLRSLERDIDEYSRHSGHHEQPISALRYPTNRGEVDIADKNGTLFRLRIQLQPTGQQVQKVLNMCRSVLPSAYSEKFYSAWWHVLQWLSGEPAIDQSVADREWSAFTILLLATTLNLAEPSRASRSRATSTSPKKRRQSGSIGQLKDSDDWKLMNLLEAPNALSCPSWATSKGWEWTVDEEEADNLSTSSSSSPGNAPGFITQHVQWAQAFRASAVGENALGPTGYLPTCLGRSPESRRKSVVDLVLALHLLLEEQTLDIMTPEYSSPGRVDLRLLLCRIVRWLKWPHFLAEYELGIQEDLDPIDDTELTINPAIPEPNLKPSVLDWIESNLTKDKAIRYMTPRDIFYSGSLMSSFEKRNDGRWDHIVPKTLMFEKLFAAIRPSGPTSPALDGVELVEAMFRSGMGKAVLESLPESVLVPLKDAIATCQPQPPTSWSKDLLELVNRSDISLVLSPGFRPRKQASNVLTPTHTAAWDYRVLCQTVEECNNIGYEEGEGTERQAVIRALFKDDRRLNEAQDLLATHKARVIRLAPLPGWSEAEYLDRQKELVSKVASGTLAIPAGRGMLYYSLRYPLLTQKFHISGFNLNCLVQPMNMSVAVDKSLFTEEKVCWGFFHQGVAAGLAISPQAKGIDTSWILYNKPGQDLSNRHAGFLLALGLNGHLKNIAKWVAFKYLTPKHTMTSIGLLLGLAVSYLGTMDSLITRLLSVHATRMLPRGAANLNLSPLTQTSGIMGIGLLYCNSQHRRMSEIMMSEIEHVDEDEEEDPLRHECYRLAAGFALGFINLGKGTDLKGLHDMRLTEKLITLATATKKVEIVHLLDRAAAGAVIALTLIYMKSEDTIVARKIDVPESALQFDYVRPNILLLRTVAKNLIMWSQIQPTRAWIDKVLPAAFKGRCDSLPGGKLGSGDMPFFSILAGLCFSIALRFAGSASHQVRDLLVHFLDQFMAVSRFPTRRPGERQLYDEELARDNARMCTDVLALSCSIVMAGTGDLEVLRRLRALHGRDDGETPYGSHLAAHQAIGALFLGCGTATFGTSNLAIASLLLAFYPDYPTTVMDNRSHLQAFRHFWVLATDSRCLVAKDVSTGQPISVPVVIRTKASTVTAASEEPEDGFGSAEVATTRVLRSPRKSPRKPSTITKSPSKTPSSKRKTPASKSKRSTKTPSKAHDTDVQFLHLTTPCLLPPLSEILTLRTDAGQSFWNISLNFESNPELATAFRNTPQLYLRRRPAYSGSASTPLNLMSSSNNTGFGEPRQPLEWIFDVPALNGLTRAEKATVLEGGASGVGVGGAATNSSTGGTLGPNMGGDAEGSAVDVRLQLEEAVDGLSRERMMGLRLLFEWAEKRGEVLPRLADADAEGDSLGGTRSRGAAAVPTSARKSRQRKLKPSHGGDNGVGDAGAEDGRWFVRDSVVEQLKGKVWLAGKVDMGE